VLTEVYTQGMNDALEKRVFAECPACGTRFHLMTVPVGLREAVAIMERAICPHCGRQSGLAMCKTDGAPVKADPIMLACSGCGRMFPRNELLEDFRRDLWCDDCDGVLNL
jgi:transcription elongation factor Elf1